MGKPEVLINDAGLTTVAAIKEAAGLDPMDWKSFFARVQQFISENEDTTSKTPRAWKKAEWKDLAEAFMDEEDNGKTYFHHSRGNTNDDDFLFWPEDREVITYLGFSIIKFESAKYHSKKRKADGDKGTPTPKKAKTAKLAAEASEDKAEDGEEENEEGEGEDDQDDKITAKSAKPAKKAAPKKTDTTAKGKKAVSTFKSPVTPASMGAAKKQVVKKAATSKIDETSGDESEDDGINPGSVKRKAPAPPAEPIVTKVAGSGLAFAGISPGFAPPTSSKNGNAQAAKEPTPKTEDDDETAEEPFQSIFNNASSPAVAGAETTENEIHTIHSSIENDEDTMSKYINIPEDIPPKEQNNKEAQHANDDSSKNPLAEAALLLKNLAEHDKYPGNANNDLTGVRDKYPESAHKDTRVDTPLHLRSPGLEPRSGSLLQHHSHLQSPTRTPSVGAHVHLPTTISLSLTLLSGTDNATSHLMVVPTSATFAEILGRYVVQLPQGDVGHQALADAANCAVKGTDGKVQRFGFREAGTERLWRAAIGRSVRSVKAGAEDDDVVEVELL